MKFSPKVVLLCAAALLSASSVSAVQPRMAPVPIVSAARLAEIRGDAGVALNPAATPDPVADDNEDVVSDEESSEDTLAEAPAAEDAAPEDDAAEDGGADDAGESTSEGLVVAKEEEGKRLPEADVIGEAPHTTLSSNEVDQVARYVLQGARKAHCEGKAEYCDLQLKSCKDDDCKDDEEEKKGGAEEESAESSSEDEEESSAESSEEEESASESAAAAGSEEEPAAEESKEAEASGAGAAEESESDESEESSEESLEATLSDAEQKALKDLQN